MKFLNDRLTQAEVGELMQPAFDRNKELLRIEATALISPGERAGWKRIGRSERYVVGSVGELERTIKQMEKEIKSLKLELWHQRAVIRVKRLDELALNDIARCYVDVPTTPNPRGPKNRIGPRFFVEKLHDDITFFGSIGSRLYKLEGFGITADLKDRPNWDRGKPSIRDISMDDVVWVSKDDTVTLAGVRKPIKFTPITKLDAKAVNELLSEKYTLAEFDFPRQWTIDNQNLSGALTNAGDASHMGNGRGFEVIIRPVDGSPTRPFKWESLSQADKEYTLKWLGVER
ncbi:MAG: hypothetical protein R3C09_19845 [Pirellulaceae bacterium]